MRARGLLLVCFVNQSVPVLLTCSLEHALIFPQCFAAYQHAQEESWETSLDTQQCTHTHTHTYTFTLGVLVFFPEFQLLWSFLFILPFAAKQFKQHDTTRWWRRSSSIVASHARSVVAGVGLRRELSCPVNRPCEIVTTSSCRYLQTRYSHTLSLFECLSCDLQFVWVKPVLIHHLTEGVAIVALWCGHRPFSKPTKLLLHLPRTHTRTHTSLSNRTGGCCFACGRAACFQLAVSCRMLYGVERFDLRPSKRSSAVKQIRTRRSSVSFLHSAKCRNLNILEVI